MYGHNARREKLFITRKPMSTEFPMKNSTFKKFSKL